MNTTIKQLLDCINGKIYLCEEDLLKIIPEINQSLVNNEVARDEFTSQLSHCLDGDVQALINEMEGLFDDHELCDSLVYSIAVSTIKSELTQIDENLINEVVIHRLHGN
jgi:hypothetical protein